MGQDRLLPAARRCCWWTNSAAAWPGQTWSRLATRAYENDYQSIRMRSQWSPRTNTSPPEWRFRCPQRQRRAPASPYPARAGPKHLAVQRAGDTVATVRHVNQNSSSGGRKATSAARSFLWWMSVALLIYLLPFIVLTMDEVILHTNWFSKHLPAWCGDVMRGLYPFSRIFGD